MVLVTIKEVKEQDKKIVYMVDEFSTVAKAEVVHSKKPETISTVFARRWIKEGPGRPTRGVASNSKEDIKELKMKKMTMENELEIYLINENIPGNMGRKKRKHYFVDRMVDKLMKKDPQLSLEDVVNDAVSKHNIQIIRRGLSPRQLMFGKQGQASRVVDNGTLT